MAFVASALYIVGMLVGAAFALYPVVLPASTDPALNLTIYNTAAGEHGLTRRPHLVDPGDDPGARLLHPAVSHVQRQSAAGGRRLLRPNDVSATVEERPFQGRVSMHTSLGL